MSPGDLDILFQAALVLGGAAVLVRVGDAPWRDRTLRLPPWRLGAAEAALALWALGTAYFVALVVVGLLRLPTEGAGPGPELLDTLVRALVLQLAYFGAFALLSQFLPPPEKPAEPPSAGWAAPLRRAALWYLGTALFILPVAILWVLGLSLWSAAGITVPLEAQSVVQQRAGLREWPWLAPAAIVIITVLAPLAEEMLFRRGLYRWLKSFLPPLGAATAASAAFSAIHFNLAVFLPLFLLAMALTAAYERSGDLRVPILLHALFNAANLIRLALGAA